MYYLISLSERLHFNIINRILSTQILQTAVFKNVRLFTVTFEFDCIKWLTNVWDYLVKL